jgi:hypothetical protein
MAQNPSSNFGRIVVTDHDVGRELRLITPDRYSTDIAIAILKFLEAELRADIKNTGWKDGYGIDVAAGVPILVDGLAADLNSDGSEIIVRRLSGTSEAFERLCGAIRSLIEAR